MNVTAVRPAELGERERARWRELLSGDPSLTSPFLTPEFAGLVGRHRARTRIAVLEEAGSPVGFLPFEAGATGVGHGLATGDVQAMVAAPETEWDPPTLVRRLGLGAWRFDHLLAAQRPLQPFHRSASESRVMDLSRGLTRYRADLEAQSGTAKKLEQAVRRITRDIGPVTIEFASRDAADLDRLMEWKSASYRRLGVADALAEPWKIALVRELADADARLGTLSTLRAGERTLAAHLGPSAGGVLAYWLPSYDPDFARYSPGLVLLLGLADECSARGWRTIDLGKGDEPYKRRIGTDGYTLAAGTVPARGRLFRGAHRVRASVQRRVRRRRNPGVVGLVHRSA